MFRATFNRRLKYFAALQEISDLVCQCRRPGACWLTGQVTAPEFNSLAEEIQDAQNEINKSEVKLAKMTVKGRYLQHLGTDERNDQELKDECIICMGSSDDTKAVLLDCGHFFCVVCIGRGSCLSKKLTSQSCYREFRRSMHSRKCPSCRAESESNDKQVRSSLLTISRRAPDHDHQVGRPRRR